MVWLAYGLSTPAQALSPIDSLQLAVMQDFAVRLFAEEACQSDAWFELASVQAFTQQRDSLEAYLDAGKRIAYRVRNELGQPSLAHEVYQKVLQNLWRRPAKETEWKSLGWLMVNTGYNLIYRLGRFQEATPYYEHSLRVFADTLGWKTAQVDGFVKRELANLYTRQGDYASAETLLNEILANSLALGENDMAAEICNDLGLLYNSLGQVDKALLVYNRGLAIPTEWAIPKGLIQMNRAHVLASMRPGEALESALNAVHLFSLELEEAEHHPQAAAYLGMSLNQVSAVYAKLGDFPKAMQYNEQAEATLIAFYGHSRRRELGKVYVSNGQLYRDMGCLDEATDWYQQALKSVLYAYEPQSADDLPTPDMIYAENTILDALAGLAEVYGRSEEVPVLERALDCYHLAFEVEKHLRQRHLFESSSLSGLEYRYERTESAIAIALRLFDRTHNPTYAQVAFGFAERCKSVLLLESLRAGSAGLSAADQALEATMQQAVADAEKQLYEARAEDAPDSLLRTLEADLLRTRAKHGRWVEALADKHPDYYRRRYDDQPVEVSEIQNMLAKDQAMLAYFSGQKQLYVFVINKSGLQVLSLEAPDSLSTRVQQFLRTIDAFQQIGSPRQNLCEQYTAEAQQLYQWLIAPVEKACHLPGRLLIIPGGGMSLLPFDALLTSEPKEACYFKDYPYLLHRYEIGMGYSATLQYTLWQSARQRGRFAGFAPSFDGSGGWAKLACSAHQLRQIADDMDGDVFEGKAASIEAFKRAASDYSLLHLATHAQANTAQGDFSFIVFNSPTGGYDTLYVNDFYDLELAAELIALSACETADGEVYRSEGVISLARGLLQAGARSVLSTLWSVKEEASCALASRFYVELAKGKRKSEALCEAKRACLREGDPLTAHPAYWAAFQLTGNERPISRTFSAWWWALSLLPIVWLLRKKAVGFTRKNRGTQFWSRMPIKGQMLGEG